MKKKVMVALWRVQQAQMIISIVFWSLTLTGVFYPYVAAKWLNDTVGHERVFLGMMIMFLVVVGSIFAFGLAYDRFKFWKEQQYVIQERNPYTYGPKMWPQNIVLWEALLYPEDDEAASRARAMIFHSLQDPEVWAAYQEIKREVGEY